jgi:hypothetical protein
MKTIVFELQFNDWAHVDCNRGFLQSLVNVSADPVYFVGAGEHINNILDIPDGVPEIYSRKKLSQIHFIPVSISGYYAAIDLKNEEYYADIIRRFFADIGVDEEDRIIFLSAQICMLSIVSKLDIPADIFLMFHYELDYIMDANNMQEYIISERTLVPQLAKRDNIHWMLF